MVCTRVCLVRTFAGGRGAVTALLNSVGTAPVHWGSGCSTGVDRNIGGGLGHQFGTAVPTGAQVCCMFAADEG